MNGFLVVVGTRVALESRLAQSPLGGSLGAILDHAVRLVDGESLFVAFRTVSQESRLVVCPVAGTFVVESGRFFPTDVAGSDPLESIRGDPHRLLQGSLNGEFSVCGVAAGDESVFAGTDYFGVRSLYYYHDAGILVLGDACLPIVDLLGLRSALDRKSIANFLAAPLGFDTKSGSTFYSGIKKLPPRQLLTWFPVRGLRLTSAGVFRPSGDIAEIGSDIPAIFADALRHAILDRCNSARTALALSGGLDSSAIALALAQLGRQDSVTCYTAAYDRIHPCHEAYFSGLVTGTLGIEHRILTGDHDRYHFPCAVSVPWADECCFLAPNIDRLRQMHSDSGTVLSGLGADEVFAFPQMLFPRELPFSLRRMAKRWLRSMRRHRGANEAHVEAEAAWIQPEMVALAGESARTEVGSADLPEWAQSLESCVFTGDGECVDEAGCFRSDFSLPFLDLRVFRVCMSREMAAAEQANGKRGRKQVLRSYLQPSLPAALVDRPKTAAGWIHQSVGRMSRQALRPIPQWLASGVGEFVKMDNLPDPRDERSIDVLLTGLSLASWLHFNRTTAQRWVIQGH